MLLMGKSIVSMAIFNSYVSLPEGNTIVGYNPRLNVDIKHPIIWIIEHTILLTPRVSFDGTKSV